RGLAVGQIGPADAERADIGDVLEEDEPENELLVLPSVHRPAQLLGRPPEQLLNLPRPRGPGTHPRMLPRQPRTTVHDAQDGWRPPTTLTHRRSSSTRRTACKHCPETAWLHWPGRGAGRGPAGGGRAPVPPQREVQVTVGVAAGPLPRKPNWAVAPAVS